MIFVTLIERFLDDILARLPGGKGRSEPVPPPPLSPREAALNRQPSPMESPKVQMDRDIAPENERQR